MKTIAWLLLIFTPMNDPPTITLIQRFDTIEHCETLVRKIPPKSLKSRIEYFCAEGIIEPVK